MKQTSFCKHFLTLWLFGLTICFVQAQTDCSNLLRLAQRTFDDGHPQEALELIRDCIEQDNFSPDQSVQALRLVTIIYLLENDSLADQSFIDLLKRNPEFRVDTALVSDPAELVQLYHSFHTDPRVYVGIQAGINRSSVREMQYFDISPNALGSKTYLPQIGFQGGFYLSVPLVDRRLRLQTGVNYMQVAYDYSNNFDAFGEPSPSFFEPNSRSDSFFVKLSETQRLVQIPLILSFDFDQASRYNFQKNKVVPFIYGGVSYHRLINAAFPEVSLESGIGRFKSTSNFSFGNETISEARRKHNLSLIMGGGIKVKANQNYFTFDFRYTRWIQNVVEPDERAFYGDLVHGFGHLDSDFTFNTFSLSIGYEIPIYKPARRKK